MKSQSTGLKVAGAVFGVVCLVQLLRLLTQAEVIIADTRIPLWASGVALIFSGALSAWMWMLSSRHVDIQA